MKGREVGIMKGWKVGETRGNHATTLRISTSKIRLKNETREKGREPGMQGTGGGVAWEQALRGTLAVGREKEGELATTSQEFEYLHRKRRCEMLIGGDISYDAITLARVF